MAETIVIKKSYFNNIETAVSAINEFIESKYKVKNFPMLDGTSDMDYTMKSILSMINSVEPKWISDPPALASAIDSVSSEAAAAGLSEEEPDGEAFAEHIPLRDKMLAIADFFKLKAITDHFSEFGALMNGIYSFELFTVPSKFRSEIELFSCTEVPGAIAKFINAPFSVFSLENYVSGLFHNADITFPESLNEETEIERVKNFQPLSEDINITTDDTIQEAAAVNYFTDMKPQHIKYDERHNKFVLSDQLKKVVNGIIDNISKCDDTKTLRIYFASKDAFEGKPVIPDLLTSNVIPFILAKVYNNKSKFPDDKINVDNLGRYIKSYGSITGNNPGTKRFVNYDVFSTFKIDKQGTIDFLKDFLTLELVNSPNARITNNGLLSCFNIFDSRIYLDTLYNLIPKEQKKDKFATEDGFVKFIRARINKNSRNANVYAQDKAMTTPNNDAETEQQVAESTNIMLKQFGNMDTTDMHLCEQYHTALYNEINLIDSRMFAEGVSSEELAEDIASITEAYDGRIPEYMQTRVKLSDEQPNVSLSSIPVSDIPANPIPDLASSIDQKVSDASGYSDMLGAGAPQSGGSIVYNITNNYNYNSNNTKTVTNTNKNINKKDDHSTGKTETITKNDNSTGDHSRHTSTTKITKDSYNKTNDIPFNNNNNSEDRNDTSKMDNLPTIPPPHPDMEGLDDENLQEFASGISVKDLFAFLEDGELTDAMSKSEEPLSSNVNTMEKPRGDLLTTAMDVDRNSLSFQQKMKRKVQKGVQTVDAITKPVTRTKQWLAGIVDSLVQRQEAKVKQEIIENPSYRTTLFKAGRLALKLGLFGIMFTINGYLGAAYAVAQVSSHIDRDRLKKEVQNEFGEEMKILEDKIRLADQDNTPESRQAKWQMMRQHAYLSRIVAETPKAVFKTQNTIV